MISQEKKLKYKPCHELLRAAPAQNSVNIHKEGTARADVGPFMALSLLAC